MSNQSSPSDMGEWAFLVGIILAIILGLFPDFDSEGVSVLFLMLGAIVGVVNITKRESWKFLIAAVALLVVGTGGFQQIPALGNYFEQIFYNITSFVAPAVVIVGLKSVLDTTRDR